MLALLAAAAIAVVVAEDLRCVELPLGAVEASLTFVVVGAVDTADLVHSSCADY